MSLKQAEPDTYNSTIYLLTLGITYPINNRRTAQKDQNPGDKGRLLVPSKECCKKPPLGRFTTRGDALANVIR